MERVSDIVRGYCVVRIVGAEPARFLEFCAARDISFWGAWPQDEFTLLVNMRQEQVGLAQPAAERCCCEADVLETVGGRAFASRIKKRYALWVLPLCVAFLIILSSFFVWRIEVTGNEDLTETEIINALEESGIAIGSYWPTIRSESVGNSLLLELPELKWVGISVFGSRVNVNVRERTEIPQIVDEDAYTSVVATQAGIIVRMSVLEGHPLFKNGQTVIKDDVLISGIINSELSGSRIVHAEGEVEARTWYELCAVLPMEYTEKSFSGKTKSRYTLVIGDTRVKFYRNGGNTDTMCDNIITEHNAGIAGFFTLPVSIIREQSRLYELRPAEYSQLEAREFLEALLNAELLERIGEGGQVVSAEFTMSLVEGTYVGTLRAECKQLISSEKPLTQAQIDAAKAAGEEDTKR